MKQASVGLAIILLAAVFTAGRMTGQDKTAPPDTTKVKKGSLPAGWKVLSLTEKQKADAYAIIGKARLEIKAMEAKIAERKAQEHSDLVAILTDAQKQQLAKALGIEPVPAPKVDSKVEEKREKK